MSHEDECHAIEQWLIKNNYSVNKCSDTFEKILCWRPYNANTLHSIRFDNFLANPLAIVRETEEWHKKANMFYSPWQWGDEETRKIELDEFYKGKKPECQHEKGATPLTNSKNELWIICKKCGKDLEIVKK